MKNTHTHTHTHTHTYIYIYIYIYIFIYMRVCVCVRVCAFMCVWLRACVCVWVCVCFSSVSQGTDNFQPRFPCGRFFRVWIQSGNFSGSDMCTASPVPKQPSNKNVSPTAVEFGVEHTSQITSFVKIFDHWPAVRKLMDEGLILLSLLSNTHYSTPIIYQLLQYIQSKFQNRVYYQIFISIYCIRWYTRWLPFLNLSLRQSHW